MVFSERVIWLLSPQIVSFYLFKVKLHLFLCLCQVLLLCRLLELGQPTRCMVAESLFRASLVLGRVLKHQRAPEVVGGFRGFSVWWV